MVNEAPHTAPPFRSIWPLAARYVAFAVVATLVNLAVQRLVLAVMDGAGGFVMAVGFGTLAGLVLKYVLDKKWIFYDRHTTGVAAQGRQFSVYLLMGVGTTVIFWGSETVFWLVWQTDAMRELGAVLGLGVGYIVKYNLDRRYVFPQVVSAA